MLVVYQVKAHYCCTYRGIVGCGVEGGMGGRVAGMFGASPLNFGVELGLRPTSSATTDFTTLAIHHSKCGKRVEKV